MRNKLFWKGGSFVRSLLNSWLTNPNAALVQDRIALPASCHVLQILSNPPFLILTHFFGLLRTFPLCLLHRGYVRAADIQSKENFKIHLRLNPESGDLTGYQCSVDGDENVWYLRGLVMVHQVVAIISFVLLARPQDTQQAEHGANQSPPSRGYQ